MKKLLQPHHNQQLHQELQALKRLGRMRKKFSLKEKLELGFYTLLGVSLGLILGLLVLQASIMAFSSSFQEHFTETVAEIYTITKTKSK